MNSLKINEIISELLCWYSSKEIADKVNVTSAEVLNWSRGEVAPREATELKIRSFFENHVQENSSLVSIGELDQYVGSTLLVDTPDGFQVIKRFIEKGNRECTKISTQNRSLTASNDHLVETDFGWVKQGSIEIGDKILTVSGIEMITEVVPAGISGVFDVEVEHVNHRLWTEGISSHNSGKSFLLSNVMSSAQRDGAFIFAIDTENALDHEYLARVGVDSTDDTKFMGVSVVTISDVVSVVSDFVKMYEKEYGKYNEAAPRVLICLDSLDMLLTDAENAHFNDGVQKGDQGQRAKQMKAFLKTMVSRIKALNIAFIGTHQVYPADPLAGEGKWAVNNAIRYSASQIVLITKLKLKADGEVSGIRMYVETFKSRFAKLGSKVEVMVPYDKGMNANSGLLELLETEGVVARSGAWWNCQFPGEDRPFSFQSTKLTDELVQKLLSHPKLQEEAKLFEESLLSPEVGVDIEHEATSSDTKSEPESGVD